MNDHPRTIRTLCMVLALLAGGAIVNVAVAWGCAASSPVRQLSDVAIPYRFSEKTYFFIIRRSTAVGMDKNVVMCAFPWTVAPDSQGMIRYQPYFGAPEESIITADRSSWSRLGDFVDTEQVSGWPSRSVWQNLTDSNNSHFDREWLSELFGMGKQRSVRPYWPGFAINTVFYAAILWLFAAASGFVRRCIRARRGQCPACAYPIGTSEVCTECGKLVKSRNAQKQRAEMV